MEEEANKEQEEPTIAQLFRGRREKKEKKVVSSKRKRKTQATDKESENVAVDAETWTGLTGEGTENVAAEAETSTGFVNGGNDARVHVSLFDYSVENFFGAMDTISKLFGEAEDDNIPQNEIQRLSSSITFLREWSYYKYEPKAIRFACELGSREIKDVVSTISLPQFSSATVPKKEGQFGDAKYVESSKDFVMYAGGSVWALDWCPRIHETLDCSVKSEFIAVAAHPPGASYHKIGSTLTGRGVIQIWCILNISQNNEVSPQFEKQKRGHKRSGVMKEKSTVLKKPIGRPRKKPTEEPDDETSALLKRPRGRPRKKPIEEPADEKSPLLKKSRGRPRKKLIEEPADVLNFNDQYVEALAVQLPEGSAEMLPADVVAGNSKEYAIQDNGKKQKSCREAISACNIVLETSTGKRSLETIEKEDCYKDDSPLSLTQYEDDTNHQAHHSSGQASVTADCSIPQDITLPRVVSCLAHDGKVAWDVKWRPYNEYDSLCKHRMGYLAVLLGNGSLEVWEVPHPRALRAIYSYKEGTDPRFIKLEPVFRCSDLKCGGIQSIPLTVEWSVLPPHDYLLAGCHDGTVSLWKFSAHSSCKDTRPLLFFRADTVPIRAVAWAPFESNSESANVILTAGHGDLKFWDLRDPFRPLWNYPVSRNVYSLDWLSNPSCVIMSFDDGTLKTLSLVKAAYDVPVTGLSCMPKPGSHIFMCSSFSIWSIQVSRITGMVAYCCADGSVLRFQLTTKGVESEHSKVRPPQFMCGSITEENSTLTVNIIIENSPIPLMPLKKGSHEPSSMRAHGERLNEMMATTSFSDNQTLALCNSDDPGLESESEGATVKSKKIPKVSSSGKENPVGDQASVCRDNQQMNDNGKSDPESKIEVFPPKTVALHRVRWNMNRGSERWLCYGGASGIVRCHEIVLSDLENKLAKKR
ncbi:General transcription factor 3C polypeptide 2 [Quillaja saponaria]|uniref:General transcription factor 3C polypeptide 2 n=1 Tax=Quillaja saponaria TaxID=32244 RepID=A0AAD7Q757_QUISA|nr:General transcription factor 3C polypeptide 2 [Quillaja saponaria]